MNSPKEPEPGPDLQLVANGSGHKVVRILTKAHAEGGLYVRGAVREEFISG